MANLNFNPNACYDHGPNAAGASRVSIQEILNSGPSGTGLANDGVLKSAELRVGFMAAGISRQNTGPNVQGRTRSINNN